MSISETIASPHGLEQSGPASRKEHSLGALAFGFGVHPDLLKSHTPSIGSRGTFGQGRFTVFSGNSTPNWKGFPLHQAKDGRWEVWALGEFYGPSLSSDQRAGLLIDF